MSSDGESEVVVAESSAEDIVQRKKVQRSSVGTFLEKDDTKTECTHCHHEFKAKCADTAGLLRHLKHMHPNVSTCTRKETESISNLSHVQNDTRKIVKPKM